MIVLGCKVKDKITGFVGVVTGIVDYISGCNQALVVPGVDKDGKQIDPGWFDLQRLEIVAGSEVVKLNNSKTPGFDAAPPIR